MLYISQILTLFWSDPNRIHHTGTQDKSRQRDTGRPVGERAQEFECGQCTYTQPCIDTHTHTSTTPRVRPLWWPWALATLSRPVPRWSHARIWCILCCCVQSCHYLSVPFCVHWLISQHFPKIIPCLPNNPSISTQLSYNILQHTYSWTICPPWITDILAYL
jgi:hypothetical protein